MVILNVPKEKLKLVDFRHGERRVYKCKRCGSKRVKAVGYKLGESMAMSLECDKCGQPVSIQGVLAELFPEEVEKVRREKKKEEEKRDDGRV